MKPVAPRSVSRRPEHMEHPRVADRSLAGRGTLARFLRSRPSTLGWLLTAGFGAPAAAAEPEATLAYPEEAAGEHALWVAPEAGRWWSSRAPLGEVAPLGLTFGYGHRIGGVRMAWRLSLLADAGGAPVKVLRGDLVSLERVYGAPPAEAAPTPATAGTLRPYWRLALGFALDLVGEVRDLGSAGYFNADNGASGGLLLSHGWGLDVFVASAWFLRAEADVQVHGAAGPTGLLTTGLVGLGWLP